MDGLQGRDDAQQLGGNIELVGFNDLDGGSMIVLKKIIGNYARTFSDQLNGIEKLSLTIQRTAQQYELHCSLRANGQHVEARHADGNVFFLVDQALKKIANGLLQ